MKNSKDYIKEISPRIHTINSLAYWLTPEGLDDPITAKLLRSSIETATDEEFKEAFDGVTKAEAADYIFQWELCYMPRWGTPELLRAITLSDDNRNESLVLRVVNMAQSIGELPEIFTPTVGIKWAMDRGYLITTSICKWVGVQHSKYGHPSNPLSIDDAHGEAGDMVNKSIYTRRVNNLHNTLGLKDKLDEFRTVPDIFKAVSSKDAELWGKNYSTFTREFWQPYIKETGYKRRKESGQ